MSDENEIDQWVSQAREGNQPALTQLVSAIQDDIHHLATRMLVNPDDALDATQEILVLLITKLSTFEGRSQFRTWVYRVAVNYLINAKKVIDREQGLSFELFEQDLQDCFEDTTNISQEDQVLINEVRVSCTLAMLRCLDLKHRAAYVLGVILELDHNEAAEVLDISRDNYRKLILPHFRGHPVRSYDAPEGNHEESKKDLHA